MLCRHPSRRAPCCPCSTLYHTHPSRSLLGGPGLASNCDLLPFTHEPFFIIINGNHRLPQPLSEGELGLKCQGPKRMVCVCEKRTSDGVEAHSPHMGGECCKPPPLPWLSWFGGLSVSALRFPDPWTLLYHWGTASRTKPPDLPWQHPGVHRTASARTLSMPRPQPGEGTDASHSNVSSPLVCLGRIHPISR